MKMKSLKAQFIGAIAMVLVAAVAMGSSTYAWFAMNTRVTVTGMEVRTKVSSNLMIADTNDVTGETQYGTTLSQTRTGLLEPTSTVDGISYFYTTDAKTNGKKNAPITGDGAVPFVAYTEATSLDNAGAGKTQYDSAFQAAYGVSGEVTTSNVAYGYIDYVFYLKATNGEESPVDLKMSECKLLYNGAAPTDKAWRVAVFVQDASKETNVDAAVAAGDRKTILTMNSAANFDDVAVSATNGTAAVTYGTAATVKAGITAGQTVYEKVTVRLWLEGQDTTCNNETYASLKEGYTLDLAFVIGSPTGVPNTAVTEIATA